MVASQSSVKQGNKEIVRRLIEEVANGRNTALAAELVADRAVSHMLYDSVNPVTGEQVGYEAEFSPGEEQSFADHEREMFPEQHTTIDEMFDMGDKVVTITTTTSTHVSGKEITVKGISVDRIADGKIAETWYLWDRLGYWQQLDIVPSTPELMAKLDALSS